MCLQSPFCHLLAGQVHDLEDEVAQRQAVAVAHQPVELAAVDADVGGVEHAAEDLLHVADVLADHDLGAGLRPQVRRGAREPRR